MYAERLPIDELAHMPKVGPANFGEEVFDDPYQFNIMRDPNPHAGFGPGDTFTVPAAGSGCNYLRGSKQVTAIGMTT